MDNFTETTTTGYGSNIMNSLKGIFFGLILLIGSITLLSWNEGRSVNQADALKEMSGNIVTLPDTKYNVKYEGKPVLVQGIIKPISKLNDALFGVKSDGLILRRNVEMYQWKENKSSKSEDKMGGSTETTTTYNYVKTWSNVDIDSSSFKHPEGHANPTMLHTSHTFVSDANIGDYYLSKSVVAHIYHFEPYMGLATMPDIVEEAKNLKRFLYIGEIPEAPKVGDMKISYEFAPGGTYTIAAESSNKALVSHATINERSFLFIRNGKIPAKQIFKEELESNSVLTWILRVVGLVMMFAAFSLMMGLFATLAKVIPFMGSLVGGATGIVAAVLTLILGSVIIALAWFASRPMLSLAIIGIGIATAVGLAKFSQKKEAPVATPETSSTVTPPERNKD